MSALDPAEPSQPSQQTSLNQPQNPASKTTTEESTARQPQSSTTVDQRKAHDVPPTHAHEAQPTSLGYGDTGRLKERDISTSDAAHSYSADPNLEGEQMRAPGEGDVARAVQAGGGGGHADQDDLMEDIDRKARDHEQELKRRGERTAKEIEEEENENWTGKKADVDVGQALGGRGNKVVLAPED